VPQETTSFGPEAGLTSRSGSVVSLTGCGKTNIKVETPTPNATTARKKTKADFIVQDQNSVRSNASKELAYWRRGEPLAKTQ
jgi:hypothetical protein